MASYYVVGGEYADTSFTIPVAGSETEIYGPFNERDAKVRWRELTGKTVDNAMVRYFLKSGNEITAKTYWVVGGEYAETSFTRMVPGKELEVYGPFNNWDEALGFWRGLTSKSVDDALVRYDIRENYQPGDSVAGKWAAASATSTLQQNATKTVSVAKSPETVLAYLKDARNWPKWAAQTFKTVREGKNGIWDVDKLDGPARLTIKTEASGVFDHVVSASDGSEISVPGRVLPIGGGAVVMMTFTRPPAYSDTQFAQDMRTVDEELAALKRVLESA